MKLLGEVKEIIRYPVKSFQGEQIPETEVSQYGLLGDRTHVFIDHSRNNKHLSAKQRPLLLGYAASYVGEELSDSFVEVSSVEGSLYRWNDELLQEVSKKTDLKLTLFKYNDGHEELPAMDAEPMLITTESSLRQLEGMYGSSLDMKRFRPNLVIKTDEQIPSFDEFDWVGKTKSI
jgi:uncharacterized protein YcbX